MKKKLPPGGHQCCEIDHVDVILTDAAEARRRLRAGSTSTVWTFSGVVANANGAAYAPSFNGGGVVRAGTSWYEFNTRTGVIGTQLETFGDTGDHRVYQECGGRVCVEADNDLYSLTPGGVFTLASSVSDAPAVITPAGGVWYIESDELSVRNASGTIRVNLSTVAVDATDSLGIVSEDGSEFWVLGWSEVAGDYTTELFHITSGAVATLVETDTLANTAQPRSFTLRGRFLYWVYPGSTSQAGQVVRYSIDNDLLEIILVKDSAISWLSNYEQEAGKSFVAGTC